MSNMYEFTSNTRNFIGGECQFQCCYCYVNALKKRNRVINDKYSGEPFLCEKEFKKSLGKNKYWFIGSMIDMFAPNVSSEWIAKVLSHCSEFDNRYLFQSKNPKRFLDFGFPKKTILCTTIESTIGYNLSKAPDIYERLVYIEMLKREYSFKTMITLEPLLEFDLTSMVELLQFAKPDQINIGAESKNHNLPEPKPEKIRALINELEKFTKVHQKLNLKRLL